VTLRIGIVSDVHMRTQDREAVCNELASVIDRFNTGFQPDLVVVLGDIIEDGDTAAEDADNVDRVRDILGDLDAPVRYLLGNHDVEHLSRDDLSDILGQELWGQERIAGEQIVFLDSSAPELSGARGEVTDDQLSLLEDAAHQEPLIFIHHPLYYRNLEDTYWWDTYPERALCGNKKEVNQVLDGQAALVVNGHIHENDHTRYNRINHVTVNAFNKETRESGVTGTYAELTVTAEELELVVKEQDTLVNRVELER
jgi:predicted MPP superfamily phosphohydrolase